jgi:putative ABC transport system substrate-binding protein
VQRFAILVGKSLGHTGFLDVARSVSTELKIEVLGFEAFTPDAIEHAFKKFAEAQVEAIVVPIDPIFASKGRRIVELAADHKLPAIYGAREFVTIGGLMSYATDQRYLFRRAAAYVDKILRGAKPADLPIEQPAKFELVINLKTAMELGLAVPPAILAYADTVIE